MVDICRVGEEHSDSHEELTHEDSSNEGMGQINSARSGGQSVASRGAIETDPLLPSHLRGKHSTFLYSRHHICYFILF